MNLPAKASAKQTSNAYHGLTPNSSAITNPVAGYQATNPIREMKITSGRFSKRYSSKNDAETRTWRKITRCEDISTLAEISVLRFRLFLRVTLITGVPCGELCRR